MGERLGEDLRDVNIGIVGYGRIGKRLSDILTAGFGITPFCSTLMMI